MQEIDLRRNDSFKTVDQNNESYWSGLDAQFYFNDLLVTDVVQFNKHFVEQVRPYYGYASYKPHTFHHGTRLIQGEFTINFQRSEFMFQVLNYLRGGGEKNQIPGFKAELEPSIPAILNTEKGLLKFSAAQIQNADPKVISHIRDNYKKGNIIDESFITDLPAPIANNLGVFEIYKGFNLSVVFGGGINGAKLLKFTPENGGSYPTTFTDLTEKDTRFATGFQLQNVSIYTSSQTITDEGRAIMETFNFMASNQRIIYLNEISGQPVGREKTPGISPPQVKR